MWLDDLELQENIVMCSSKHNSEICVVLVTVVEKKDNGWAMWVIAGGELPNARCVFEVHTSDGVVASRELAKTMCEVFVSEEYKNIDKYYTYLDALETISETAKLNIPLFDKDTHWLSDTGFSAN